MDSPSPRRGVDALRRPLAGTVGRARRSRRRKRAAELGAWLHRKPGHCDFKKPVAAHGRAGTVEGRRLKLNLSVRLGCEPGPAVNGRSREAACGERSSEQEVGGRRRRQALRMQRTHRKDGLLALSTRRPESSERCSRRSTWSPRIFSRSRKALFHFVARATAGSHPERPS